MDITALLFDMDDVLYDDTMWRRWLLQLLARMGLHRDFQVFYRTWERDYLDEVFCGRGDLWDALREYLIAVGLTKGQADEAIAASHAKRRQILQDVRPLPGVRATTAKLHSLGIPLAILSNAPWSAEKANQLLSRLGLFGRFDPVICSFDCGHPKPSRESYQFALAQLRLPASSVAFVGHNSDELEGARLAGMPTLAINYDQDAKADLYLERFDQLLTHVNYRTARLLAG